MTKIIKSDKSVKLKTHRDKVEYAKTIIFDVRKSCTHFDIAVKKGISPAEVVKYLPFASYLNLLSRKVSINHYIETEHSYVAGYSSNRYTIYRFSYPDS